MVDTQRLKDICDLRRLVEQDLGPAPLHGGRAHLWKCPFHHEQKGFSLAVWANGYRCFGACDTSGDALDWLVKYRHLTFMEALHVLGQPPENTSPTERSVFRSSSEPPPSDWQRAAEFVVSMAEDTLWSECGEPALNYLTGRGLTTQTVRAARLGYVPGDFREWRLIEGLEVPCGISIPWFAAEALWAVKVRRAAGAPKYQQLKGGNSSGLYGVDRLLEHVIALFCEGEFDTLLAQQEAGDLVAVVTLSSAASTLNARWYADLTACPAVLVAYDRDAAGEKGAKRLCSLSPRFSPIAVPFGKDIGEFYLAGGDIHQWLKDHVRRILDRDQVDERQE